MDLSWFLGFIEGEGNFCVTTGSKNYKEKRLTWKKTLFQIGQSEEAPLREIKSFLKERGISIRLYGPYANHGLDSTLYAGRGKPVYSLVLSKISEAKKLIALLDPLQWETNKRKDFESWKQVVLSK